MPIARDLEKIGYYCSLMSISGLVVMLLFSEIPLNVRIGGCFLVALWVIKNSSLATLHLNAAGWSAGQVISSLNIAACLVMGGAAAHDLLLLPENSMALWCKLLANILWLGISVDAKHEHSLNAAASLVFLMMTLLLHDPLLVYIGITSFMAATAGWAHAQEDKLLSYQAMRAKPLHRRRGLNMA